MSVSSGLGQEVIQRIFCAFDSLGVGFFLNLFHHNLKDIVGFLSMSHADTARSKLFLNLSLISYIVMEDSPHHTFHPWVFGVASAPAPFMFFLTVFLIIYGSFVVHKRYG